MLEVLFGILSALGDIIAPTPAVRWFWAIIILMVLVVICVWITNSSI
jgi:hypothetical protein